MEELTATQIAARLGVSERTILRWIHKGKITATLQANGYYLVDTVELDTLRKPTLQTPQISSSALADILTHLDAIEHEIKNLTSALHLHQELQDRQQPTSQSQPPKTTDTTQWATQHHAGDAGEIVWLEPGLAAWRSFARVHGIEEKKQTKIQNAIRDGRLPVVHGEWRRGKTLYREALNEEGRAIFHELYGFLPCPICSD